MGVFNVRKSRGGIIVEGGDWSQSSDPEAPRLYGYPPSAAARFSSKGWRLHTFRLDHRFCCHDFLQDKYAFGGQCAASLTSHVAPKG